MTLVSLSTLITPIADQVRGASDYTILDALRWSAREFCGESEVWREVIQDNTLTALPAAATVLTIPIPAGYSVIADRVDTIKVGQTLIGGWTLSPSGILTLLPRVASCVLTLDVIWKPLLGCVNYPDWLMEKHDKSIIVGALAHLKGQAQPWADPAGANQAQIEFRNAIGSAITQSWQTGSAAPIRAPIIVL